MDIEAKIRDLDPSGQMSFLEHLDELRRRLVNSVIIVVIAFTLCWFLSDRIYDFLSIPIREALSDASRRQLPVRGLTGGETVLPLSQLKEGDTGRYIFDRPTKLGTSVVAAGASVSSSVGRDSEGNLGLFTTESIYTSNAIIPSGVRLPVDFTDTAQTQPSADE